jgi:hypothetical protein
MRLAARARAVKYVTWAIFDAVAITAATGTGVWLTITGHTLQIGGLLLAIGGVMAAVLLTFRLAGGYGPGELSIWAGRLRSLEAEPSIGPQHELRQAA